MEGTGGVKGVAGGVDGAGGIGGEKGVVGGVDGAGGIGGMEGVEGGGVRLIGGGGAISSGSPMTEGKIGLSGPGMNGQPGSGGLLQGSVDSGSDGAAGAGI